MLLFTAESRTCCAITGHNLWLEMGFAHRRRRFVMAKPVTITVQRAVNSNTTMNIVYEQTQKQVENMIFMRYTVINGYGYPAARAGIPHIH